MRRLIFLFAITFLFNTVMFPQVVEVPANPDSLAAVIGKVKTVSVIGDTTIVTNIDEEQFILVGENTGQLVSILLTGVETVRDNVSKTQGRPIDWLLEIIKWLLGGSLTSVIAYGSRTVGGLKAIFSKVAKNRRLVIGIAGAVAMAWNAIQGGNFATPEFWALWGVTWFTFSMFAIGLYETVFSKIFGKTPKTEAATQKAMAEAASLLKSNGVAVADF